MVATLTPSWQLSDEHSASSYGLPVLVHLSDGTAYGPADIILPYPSWGLQPAARAVRRMAKIATLDPEQRRAVARFCAARE